MSKKTVFLHTPPGTRPFYKNDALFMNLIEKKLSAFFENWGFFPIQPPIKDYFDAYAPVLSDEQRKGSIRFINREGDLVLLRNDITLFTAKFIASRINNSDENLKYYYAGSIVRSENSDSLEEYYQIGCEIVGNENCYEELEVLVILLESLRLLKIENCCLHLGNVSFYRKLLGDISNEAFSEILKTIRMRDKEQLKQVLSSLDVPGHVSQDILNASCFIGTLDELKKASLSDEAMAILEETCSLVKSLYGLGYEDKILIDLSEVAKLDYYDGIVFHIYAQDLESPLVSGGRYDKLFKTLGLTKSAVGFSYWLFPLEKLLKGKDEYKANENDKITVGSDPLQSFKEAVESVRKNKKIFLEY